MPTTPELTFPDRIAFTFLGGLTGAAYGALIAPIAFLVTEQSHLGIIAWSAAVFAGLGFFYGNFIAEAFLALVHFLWGLVHGLAEEWRPIEEGGAPN